MAWKASLAARQSSFGGPLATVYGPMGDLIATVPADPGQDPMPRARLIAAAPDLKDRLAALLAAFDATCAAGRSGVSPAQAGLQRESARALLASLEVA